MPKENLNLLRNLRNKKEEAIQQDGMRIESLGLGNLDQWNLNLLRLLKLPALMSLPPMPQVLSRKMRRTIAQSSALLFLTAKAGDAEQPLLWGRIFERLWLEATSAGLSVQPLYAPAHYASLARKKWRELPIPTLRRIEIARKDLWHLFALPEDAPPVILFRLGYSRRQRIPSVRRPATSFTANFGSIEQ